MKIYSDKHKQALIIALERLAKAHPHNRFRLMRPGNLYRVLRRSGWDWNGSEWVRKIGLEVDSPELAPVPSDPTPQEQQRGSELILLRIMAHSSNIERVMANLRELLDVFDWEILTVSRPVPNHGETGWYRVYIRAKLP